MVVIIIIVSVAFPGAFPGAVVVVVVVAVVIVVLVDNEKWPFAFVSEQSRKIANAKIFFLIYNYYFFGWCSANGSNKLRSLTFELSSGRER